MYSKRLDLISESESYAKEEKKINEAAKEEKCSEYAIDQIINKITGGKIVDEQGIKLNEDDELSKEKAKDFLLSEKMEETTLPPIEAAKAVIRMIKEKRDSNEIKKVLKEAEEKQKLEKEGEKKAGERSGKPKDGKEKSGEKITAADIIKPKWIDLSKVKEILNPCMDKIGFIKREGKLIEKPGDITKTSIAKCIKDIQKAKPELYAMPDTVFAKNVSSNEYSIKRKYTREFKQANIVIVEDVSGSMRGTPEIWASATIINMLKEQEEGHLSIDGILLMGDYINKIELKSENRIKEYIEKRNFNFPGGTEDQEAIIEATKMVKDKEGAEVVILTDGVFDISNEMMDRILETKVKIHSLIVGDDARNIKALSELSGGKSINFQRFN